MAALDGISRTDAQEIGRRLEEVHSLSFVTGERAWPLVMRLPLKRDLGDERFETGHMQRDRFGVPEPVVYTQGPIRCRRYADPEQLVAAGWRVD